jgi:hypothetical protein
VKRYVLLVLITILACWLLWPEAREPNAELAATAREAVEFARDVESSNRSYLIWADRYRLLGIAVAVAVPVAVAYLVLRASRQNTPEGPELLEAMAQRGWVNLPPRSTPQLESGASASLRPALPEAESDETHSEDEEGADRQSRSNGSALPPTNGS